MVTSGRGQFWRRFARPNAVRGLAQAGVEPFRLVYDTEPGLVYAVGDVHGHLDLLRQLEDRITRDRKARRRPALLVLLGDLVDRGPASAQVIDHVMTAPPEGFERICLMGNHEAMMLQFLADPSPDSMWLSQGGMQTLMSYGVSETMLQGAGRRALRQMIEAYVPTEHLVFLRNMPVLLETPEHLFVHAGIDRTVAISEQPDDILLWYRDDLVETYDGLGRQVVHGHTFTPEPLLSPFRVAIDTGAYHTGTLTAAAFSPGKVPRIINVVATQGSP